MINVWAVKLVGCSVSGSDFSHPLLEGWNGGVEFFRWNHASIACCCFFLVEWEEILSFTDLASGNSQALVAVGFMRSTIARMEAISWFTFSLGDESIEHICVKASSIFSKCPTKVLGRISFLSSPTFFEKFSNLPRDSLSFRHGFAVFRLSFFHLGQTLVNEFFLRSNNLIVHISCFWFISFCLGLFLFHFIPVVSSVVVLVTPHSNCIIWISCEKSNGSS